MRDREQREEVLRHIDRYVIKPVGESGGYGVVIGPHASEKKLEETRARVLANPDNFIAQPVISLSVHPTMITDAAGVPTSAAAPCRPAAVRAAGREAARAARRTDARRAARGLAGRQLLARRRQQGHLGAGGVAMLRRIADNLVLGGAQPRAGRMARAAGRRKLSSADRNAAARQRAMGAAAGDLRRDRAVHRAPFDGRREFGAGFLHPRSGKSQLDSKLHQRRAR